MQKTYKYISDYPENSIVKNELYNDTDNNYASFDFSRPQRIITDKLFNNDQTLDLLKMNINLSGLADVGSDLIDDQQDFVLSPRRYQNQQLSPLVPEKLNEIKYDNFSVSFALTAPSTPEKETQSPLKPDDKEMNKFLEDNESLRFFAIKEFESNEIATQTENLPFLNNSYQVNSEESVISNTQIVSSLTTCYKQTPISNTIAQIIRVQNALTGTRITKSPYQKQILLEEFLLDPKQWNLKKCVQVAIKAGLDHDQVKKWNWDQRKKPRKQSRADTFFTDIQLKKRDIKASNKITTVSKI